MARARRYMELQWPELNVRVRARLADEKNPTICEFLWRRLPLRLLQSHAMVSGDTMYAFHNVTDVLPAEHIEDFTDERHWGHVPTSVGCIRFATFGYQIVVIQWGPDRTEYERRVPVAYVEKPDLEKLAMVGRRVLDGMSTGDTYTLVMKRAR